MGGYTRCCHSKLICEHGKRSMTLGPHVGILGDLHCLCKSRPDFPKYIEEDLFNHSAPLFIYPL